MNAETDNVNKTVTVTISQKTAIVAVGILCYAWGKKNGHNQAQANLIRSMNRLQTIPTQ